jgi:arylsulfatase A
MKRGIIISILLLCTAAGVLADRPNIILIMTDDMGRETLGIHGGLSYKTPVLDKMGTEGLVFDHCYSLPICTP